MSTTAVPTPEASTNDNSFSRVIGVLFSPKPTFESIVKRPTWIVPVILMCIIGLAVTAVFAQRVGWRSYIERQIEQNPSAQKRMEGLTADQREDVLEKQTKFWGAFGYVLPVVATFLGLAIAATALMVAFNVVGGTRTKFATAIAIVSYAWVPFLIHGILSIVTMYLKDPATIDIKNLLASNPGAFLSDDSPQWLISLLRSLDIFTIWTLLLAAIGFSATNPKKLTVGKAFGTIFCVWMVWVLVQAGLAGLSS
jgi:hypothetical protein